MSEKKEKKLRQLETEISVKNIIIKELAGLCVTNNIEIPSQIKDALFQLYGVKI